MKNHWNSTLKRRRAEQGANEAVSAQLASVVAQLVGNGAGFAANAHPVTARQTTASMASDVHQHLLSMQMAKNASASWQHFHLPLSLAVESALTCYAEQPSQRVLVS